MRPRNSKVINWSGFSQALKDKPEKRPEGSGWKTKAELTKEYKCNDKRVRHALRTIPHETFVGKINKNGNLIRAIWHRPL